MNPRDELLLELGEILAGEMRGKFPRPLCARLERLMWQIREDIAKENEPARG